MALFQSLKNKLFGSKVPVFKPFLPSKDASIQVGANAELRRQQLEQRVKAGTSSEVYPNLKNTTQGNVATVDAFLDGFPLTRFPSSNVWEIVYDRTKDTLHIQYMAGKGKNKSGPGTWYGYASVSLAEAKQFYWAASRGVKVWDILRVRGSNRANKKPTTKGARPPSYLPLGRKKSNILQSP